MPVSILTPSRSELDKVFLEAFQREVAKVWEEALWQDGSSQMRGGLADLVTTTPSPRIGGIDRFVRYSWTPLRANGAQKPLQSVPHHTDTRHDVRLGANNGAENPVLTAPDKR